MGAKFGCNILHASPTNRPQPKAITIVIVRLKLWPAAGCEAKVEDELSSRALAYVHLRTLV